MAIGKGTHTMTSNLCVAGCSFSDHTKVDKVYGEYLAESLGMNYIHEGAGCGSNWRIWRKIYEHVGDHRITSKDILIVQYTNSERQEFFSRFKFTHLVDGRQRLRDKFNNGEIIRYKIDSYTWQPIEQEKKFLKLYQDNHVDSEFAEHQFECHHAMFETFLLANNIRTIFFKSGYRSNLQLLPEHEKISFKKTDCSNPPYNLSDSDTAHMNAEGHKNIANLLFQHIEKIGYK